MSDFAQSRFENFRFDVEVSTWYHEFRRGLFSSLVVTVRAVSLIGSIAALLAVSGWIESNEWRTTFIVIVSVLIGVVNLFDLVFQFDRLAREHTSLYQRFKALQSKIARGQKDWPEHIDDWEAEAQTIRVDEPPTYWALYNICRNQVLEKYNAAKGNERVVTRGQRFWRHIKHYRPDDFAKA